MSIYYQRFKTIDEKFWKKVEKTDTCWNWTGGKQKKGYGIFRYPRGYLAHRFSYELANGFIPDGLLVDHICQNKSCVNPSHLRLVDNYTNIHENSTHYATRTHCNKGHEFTDENTISRTDGGRRCKTCDRLRSERRRESGEWKKGGGVR